MHVLLTALVVLPASYLVGSISVAYVLTRALNGMDIRTVGSGNPGAVNVFKHVGPPAGVAVLVMDAAKAAAVVLAIQAVGLPDYALFVGALAVVIGHNWPVFLRFRGGKGVAIIFGISMAVIPLWAPLSLAVALVAGCATRSVVLGIAAGIVALNVVTVATNQGATQVALCLTLSALVVGTHYAITYRQTLRSVRQNGLRGLFTVE